MPQVPRLSPAQELAAGVLAGIADSCACHPVDQVKTQFHVNRSANGTMWDALRAEVHKGGVTRLYRGLPAAALRPQALCMYTGNEWCKVRTASDVSFLRAQPS
jgi:Mitochondrial carrier protein